MAALASTAMVFQGVDDKYSNKLMREALDLYAAVSRKKGMWSDQFLYACAPPVSHPPYSVPSCWVLRSLQMPQFSAASSGIE